MNIAKISSNGQISIPINIRKLLKLKPGDKVLFSQKPNGDIVLTNASAQAIPKAQNALTGVAEAIGIQNEDDVQAIIDEVRYKNEIR